MASLNRVIWLLAGVCAALCVVLVIVLAEGGEPRTVVKRQPRNEANRRAARCTLEPGASGEPARMGECVQGLYRYGSAQAAPPLAAFGAQGLDVANYQGEPWWPGFAKAGIRFVWNQEGDGAFFHDGNYRPNYCAQRRAGIIPGSYLFVRPYLLGVQVARFVASIRAARAACPGLELPPLLDAEVPGAYAEVAPAAGMVRAQLGGRVDVYASPGLWDGSSTDSTELDVANWGVRGRAFSGWLYRGGSEFFVAQQWCGFRCYVSGLEVDRQVDHGVLEQLAPPCDQACRTRVKRLQLYAAYRRLLDLRTLEDSRHHDCRIGDHHHAKPRRTHAEAMKWRRVCNVWLRHGEETTRAIRRLHREGIY